MVNFSRNKQKNFVKINVWPPPARNYVWKMVITMLSCSLVCFSSIMMRSADSSKVLDNPSRSPWSNSIRRSSSIFRSINKLIWKNPKINYHYWLFDEKWASFAVKLSLSLDVNLILKKNWIENQVWCVHRRILKSWWKLRSNDSDAKYSLYRRLKAALTDQTFTKLLTSLKKSSKSMKIHNVLTTEIKVIVFHIRDDVTHVL